MPTSALRLPQATQLTRILARREIYQTSAENSPLSIPDLLFIACLALAPLCLLSVRSWTIFFVFCLVGIAAWQLARTETGFAVLRGESARLWIVGALASPLIAVLAGQLIRGHWQPGLMDGPSRTLLAIALFTYLLHKQIDIVRLLEWSAPLSLLILCGVLLVHPYGYATMTSERFGTYAVDPLSLGQYATLLGFICLITLNLYGPDRILLKSLKIMGIAIAAWISIGTGSRSGWIAFPFLILLWLILVHQVRQIKTLIPVLLSLGFLGVMVYETNAMVHERIGLAINEFLAYTHGYGHDTSTGLRMSLLKMAGLLFLEQPLSGYGDSHYPALSGIPSIAPFNTEALEFALIHNGVHNEIMQNALRSGVFGLVSSLLMFIVPAVVFYRGTRSQIPSVRAAGLVGLCYIVAVFCFGLSTETFNLKYTVSFYALMVSTLAAQVLRPQTT